MPSPSTWPRDTIRELLALADASGESKAELPSARDAELFRFAIYSFRRTERVGGNISVTLDGTNVILTKRNIPQVAIVQEH